MKTTLKKILPWILCIAIFYYLFTQISPQQMYESLKLANLPVFAFYALLYFFVIHTIDCLTIQRFISRFATPISHKESWLVRGVSYLIMIINYHAAQGAFAVYFKKTHKAPIAKTLGTLAFVSIMDLLLILTCAIVALGFTNVNYKGFDIRSYILHFAPFLFLGYLLWILFWRNADHPFINKWRKYRSVNWILSNNLFLIFREARLKDYLLLLAYRIPMTIAVIGGFNFALFAFQASLNWIDLYLYNPIVMLISTLPITPSGLGTGQFLSIEFFKDIVKSPLFAADSIIPASLLLASNLAWWFANQLIKSIFGAICLSSTPKSLFIDENNVKGC